VITWRNAPSALGPTFSVNARAALLAASATVIVKVNGP
jgi:hypothetical protein